MIFKLFVKSLSVLTLFCCFLALVNLNNLTVLAGSYGGRSNIPSLNLSVNPYKCGDRSINGTLTGGYGQKSLQIKLESSNNSYLFNLAINNSSWEFTIDYNSIVSQIYKVTIIAKDELNVSRQVVLENLLITKDCNKESNNAQSNNDQNNSQSKDQNQNKPKIRAVLVRTGGFVQQNLVSLFLLFSSLIFVFKYLVSFKDLDLER